MNMQAIRHSFPTAESSGVMPVDNPTVANAETVSNRSASELLRPVERSGSCSVRSRMPKKIHMNEALRKTMEIASRTTLVRIRRLKILISSFPRTTAGRSVDVR